MAPALGVDPDDLLDPPFLATAFGQVVADASGDGCVVRQGYVFKLFLPGPTPGVGAATPGLGEDPAGGAKAADVGLATWGSANCEIMWSAYAWPTDAEKTGNRAFFINQEGDLLQYDNRDQEYEGIAAVANIPAFDAALSDELAGSMDTALGLRVMGLDANDGNVWTAVGN